MMKLFSATVMIICLTVTSALAATPEELIAAYNADPVAAVEQYDGQEMEFSGLVISCERAFGSGGGLWAVRIIVGSIDAIGYVSDEISVGRSITLRGKCFGFQRDPEVAVILESAEAELILPEILTLGTMESPK
jgi:hypothetical protein